MTDRKPVMPALAWAVVNHLGKMVSLPNERAWVFLDEHSANDAIAAYGGCGDLRSVAVEIVEAHSDA